MIEELTQLAQYGLAGISISLVGLIGLLISRVFKFMGNHVDHNTKAWNKNTEALTRLSGKISEDIKSQKETSKTLRDLQLTIIKKDKLA